MGKTKTKDDIDELEAKRKKKGGSKEDEEESPSLMQIIQEQAQEEDTDPRRTNITLRKIIGGEILIAEIVRKQIWVILLITLFLVIYIAQGYSYKKYILEINNLTEELKDAKYRALSVKSDLTEHTRESNIIELLKLHKDSLLQHSDIPRYIIEVPEK